MEKQLQFVEELQATEMIACRNLKFTLISYVNGNTVIVEIVRG